MKLALAQINPTVGDFAGNAEKILAAAREAARRGADLAIFPEVAVCGYPPEDLVERAVFLDRNREQLEHLAREVPLPILVGFVGRAEAETGKSATDSAALVANGRILFEQTKMLLPTYDVFDEARYFAPARQQQVFALSGSALGITICEDIWNDKHFWQKCLYPRDPVEELIRQGAGIIINISASPYTMDKRTLRLEMLRAIAREYRRPVVYVNQVGGNDGLIFDGSSVALDAEGRVRAQAYSFAEDLVVFDTEAGGEIHEQTANEFEAVYQALVLGTRDYVRKCGFTRVVIGLSGGIDSSLVAVIASDAVGKGNVLGVGMPGPFSSPSSLSDAHQLAANLGIEFIVLPIEEVFASYKKIWAGVFAGRPEDVTEENIQARIRGNLLMALSNKFGALVLSTGNKSELAVGYCTLYGDMAGGLAVISDVPKTMVYELARLVNRDREIIPAACLTKPPSAELRPNQRDQDTLPPYEVLDPILKAYIEENQCAPEIAQKFGLDEGLVREVMARVDRAEYKRQQAPLGLKVTSKAFGRGRRFPIAQKFFC